MGKPFKIIFWKNIGWFGEMLIFHDINFLMQWKYLLPLPHLGSFPHTWYVWFPSQAEQQVELSTMQKWCWHKVPPYRNRERCDTQARVGISFPILTSNHDWQIIVVSKGKLNSPVFRMQTKSLVQKELVNSHGCLEWHGKGSSFPGTLYLRLENQSRGMWWWFGWKWPHRLIGSST